MNEVSKYSVRDSDVCIITTIDEHVHGLDRRSGQLLWTWGSDFGVRLRSKFRERIEGSSFKEVHSTFYLVEPSQDGSVYVAEPELPLRRLPLSIKRLVEMSPYHSNEGTVYVAERSSEVILFNPVTGSVKFRLNPESELLSMPNIQEGVLASVGRVTYKISIYDVDQMVAPRWQLIFSELVVPELSGFVHSSRDNLSPGIDGSLISWNGDNRVLWKRQFASPVVSAFEVTHKSGYSEVLLNRVDFKPIAVSSSSEQSIVHISVYEKTPFLLSTSRYHYSIDDYTCETRDELARFQEKINPTCSKDCFPGSPSFPKCLQGIHAGADMPYTLDALLPTPSHLSGDLPSYQSTTLLIDPPPMDRLALRSIYINLGTLPLVLLTIALTSAISYAIFIWFNRDKKQAQRSRGQRSRKKADNEGDDEDLKINNNEIIGYGSHGTVVFTGEFHGRKVAVKRLLIDFYEIAGKEVELLLKSDNHPNVVRYFCQKKSRQFLYIALELCICSLHDVIEFASSIEKVPIREIRKSLDRRAICLDLSSGINHLHTLGIVHRDVKPHNVLLSEIAPNKFRALITDFGLCKKLTDGQHSFIHSTEERGGTTGWRAPEVLTNPKALSNTEQQRLTRKVDVFSMGLVFFYILTDGKHPFGDLYSRDRNIITGQMNLVELENADTDAADLVHRMLEYRVADRISSEDVMLHPFFWSALKKLTFLQDLSDRLDVEIKESSLLLAAFEEDAVAVFGQDGWYKMVDKSLYENLGKYRKYNANSLQDLLRAIRNKKNHYQDLPQHVKKMFGIMPDGFLLYFTSRFPSLLPTLYRFVEDTELKDENVMRPYFSQHS